MSVVIERLSQHNLPDYEQLVFESKYSMFTHSLKFRNFIQEICPESRESYLLARVDDQVVAALPMFIQEDREGTVLNSLPFFGSHGGIIWRHSCDEQVESGLATEIRKLQKATQARSLTIIESPLRSELSLGLRLNQTHFDTRIAQISSLPRVVAGESTEDVVMRYLPGKVRNTIRKAARYGPAILEGGGEEAMRVLYEMHYSEMITRSRRAKNWDTFSSITKAFEYGEDYRIYLAREDSAWAAGLLVFYFKDYVEYFIPVVNGRFREHETLTALIYRAMVDAVGERRSARWNWGGTWKTQEGLYQFKRRWGARDFPYRYIVSLEGDVLPTAQEVSAWLDRYPNFYYFPLDVANGAPELRCN